MTGLRDTLQDAWYRKARWLWLLRPLEAAFRTVALARRGLYRYNLLRVYRAPVPVVVVGGITVGGTGKTPVVIALVEYLQQRGIRVGVVSRGYGAAGMSAPHWVTGSSVVGQCGDELALIRRRTGCPCVAAPDRAEAVRVLLANSPVDVILSDDGLQHYALGRDLEIAVLDHARGVGNGFCLPAGPLREPARRLEKVDHILYRDGPDESNSLRYQPDCLVNLDSGRQCSPRAQTPGSGVHAVAGIGQPAQFFDTLRKLGFDPRPHIFADHHDYSAPDFDGLTDMPIIMTEKDAVKCTRIAGIDAWYLKISAQLPENVTAAVSALARP